MRTPASGEVLTFTLRKTAMVEHYLGAGSCFSELEAHY
jgi:hypothetical protein